MGLSVIPVHVSKIPLIPWTEYQKRRATPEEIKQWWKDFPDAQVGIVTGVVSGICVIDIDTLSGKDLIMPLLGNYIAPECETPKSKLNDGVHYGRHLYFRCDNEGWRNNQNDESLPGVDRRANGGYVVAPPSFDGDYRWITPVKDFHKMLQYLPSAYVDYVQKNLTFRKNEQTTVLNIGDNLFNLGSRDNDIFHIANTLIKSGESAETVTSICLRLAETCNPPFPKREVLRKIDSALNRSSRKDMSLAQEVREWVMSSNGVFMSSEVVKSLQVTSKEDLKNLSRILSRLCEEGLINRYGKRYGQFRRIEGECEPLDLEEDQGEALNIKFPFWLERMVKIHPGNIIIVGGVPNAGKTAFMLNFADMNMDKHEVHYFSSEMGQIEFKERIKYFKRPIEEWKKIKIYERADDFEDVIRPNAINIIDYLEIYDEFYRVGEKIKNIWNCLQNGIAIIGLQKNPGVNVGLGGYRSIEKARLYVTLDNGCFKIEKGKNLVRPEAGKVDGMYIYYNLQKGTDFEIVGDWKRPY